MANSPAASVVDQMADCLLTIDDPRLGLYVGTAAGDEIQDLRAEVLLLRQGINQFLSDFSAGTFSEWQESLEVLRLLGRGKN